ncbi:nuclear transport factor 2 family protein [Variovorax sp. EL159]|uniref:nuclear transport factor 2 family protein n=1 Tax=Variovorax sp. EL159 TaxID=1566270 RepID=UPI00088B7358|nr:nuclear transport factor 2 family protein [Variovorax sp. EL159]SCX74171.1 SnoaL-like domain-containing protein [Variovorax sp. EL159]
MTPDALWKRYAAIWSLDADKRGSELIACLAEEVTYCDPNGLIHGRLALSDYMGEFQRGVPGACFSIRSVLHHHDRSLAQWVLQGPGGAVLQTGTSFGALAKDGRLQAISGFFHVASEEPSA